MKKLQSLLHLSIGILGAISLHAAESSQGDTFLGYRTGTKFHEPGNPQCIQKNILNFTQSRTNLNGNTYLSVDLLNSSLADPSNGGGTGAHESYITFRSSYSYPKIIKPLHPSIIKDFALTIGFDWNAKNTGVAPGKEVFVIGPTFKINIYQGSADIGLLYWKERNHNAFGIYPENNPKTAIYESTFLISLAWNSHIPLGSFNSQLKGFLNHVRPKGRDTAAVKTVGETLCRAAWLADLGPLWGQRAGVILVGPGYEFWKNKLGSPNPIPSASIGSPKPNATTACLTLQAECHF